MFKVTQLGNSRAKELNLGSLTPEPVIQTSPLVPCLPLLIGWIFRCLLHHATPQLHNNRLTYSLFFLLSFLILISFLPDEHGNSDIFSLCYSEQFNCPQPFAPNLLSYLRFHQSSQKNNRPYI